jgi:subtilisin family serine protease
MARGLETGGDRWRLPPWRVRTVISASKMDFLAWGLELNGIPALWAKSKGAGVRVAVLDTGIDVTHPDFKGAIAGVKDFSGSAWGMSDRQGHGTHTAGTIAARNNSRGVVGVAPLCDLLIGKVLGDDGSGSDQSVAAGIEWACAQGADIISMSLGSPDPSPVIQAALARAVAGGKLIVVAAGNEGPGRNTVGYPAAWSKLALAVGAVDRRGQVASFSSRGPEVDIMAPGVAVPSCWPGGDYAFLDGTSMATPFVAGTLALGISHARAIGRLGYPSQAEMEAEIAKTAKPLAEDPDGHSEDWGFGLVNPGRLLDDIGVAPMPDPLSPDTFVLGSFAGFVWVLSATPDPQVKP